MALGGGSRGTGHHSDGLIKRFVFAGSRSAATETSRSPAVRLWNTTTFEKTAKSPCTEVAYVMRFNRLIRASALSTAATEGIWLSPSSIRAEFASRSDHPAAVARPTISLNAS